MTGSHHTLVLALAVALGAAWATVLTAATGLWPRSKLRPLPHHPDVPPARISTPASSIPQTRWITALGATIRRHTTSRLVPAHGSTTPPPAPAVAHNATDPSHGERLNPPPDRHRGSDPRADRRIGWAALASLALLPLAPTLAPVPVVGALLAPMLTARSAARRHEAALVDQLPDVVDLLSLAAAAGLPVTAALGVIADRPGGPIGAAVGRAAAHVGAGGALARALAHLRAVGPQARPLVDALAHHDRYGSPLLPALERVAIETRARRRRHAEEAARRLPVTLLFPLLLTTFPAFVALTVVPLLAGSLHALSL
jgi:hypothetical protein